MFNSIVLLAASDEHKPPNPLLPQWYDVVYSVIAFVIVFLVFWKYVLPQLNKVMAERSELIEGGIAKAEAAQAEAKDTLEQYRQQLAEARTEAAQIREDARAQGQQIVADMKVTAQEESDRIVANGNSALQAQRQQIVNELRSDLGRTSVDLAEKLVGRSLADDVSKSATVDQFLGELDAANAKAGK